MALNKVFAGIERNNRARKLALITSPTPAPTTIQPGTQVLMSGRPAVALTASGNGAVTQANPVPGITSITYTNGGASLAADEAVFAFDGTYEFPVTGATTSTVSDVEVFIVKATAVLTLIANGASTAHFGYTDYPVGYRKVADRAPVRIGA